MSVGIAENLRAAGGKIMLGLGLPQPFGTPAFPSHNAMSNSPGVLLLRFSK